MTQILNKIKSTVRGWFDELDNQYPDNLRKPHPFFPCLDHGYERPRTLGDFKRIVISIVLSAVAIAMSMGLILKKCNGGNHYRDYGNPKGGPTEEHVTLPVSFILPGIVLT